MSATCFRPFSASLLSVLFFIEVLPILGKLVFFFRVVGTLVVNVLCVVMRNKQKGTSEEFMINNEKPYNDFFD